MKLETIKSFILIVLIGISILLSYTLWSYQPNSSQTISGENINKEMNVGGHSDKRKRNMIKPSEMIFHTEDNHYGFIHGVDRDKLYEQMQNWVITNFEEENANFKAADGLELFFPDEIPMELMSSLLSFGSDEVMLPSMSINRIFISFLDESKSLQLAFISSENKQISQAVINDTEAYDLLLSMITDIDEETLQPYIAVNQETKPIYIPAEPVRLPTYSITPRDINPKSFVNILFNNPSVVRETNSETIGEAYFTDSRQLSVYSDRMRMEFINHATLNMDEEDTSISEVELLDRTISDINNHYGWSKIEEYRLEDINPMINRVSFQMYYKGYPVFSNYRLSLIQQRWGYSQNNMQLIEYNRPLFLFDSELLLREADDLPSGENVIAYIENHSDSTLENIQDIRIGYELVYKRDDPDSKFIELYPMWYKKENGIWQKINFDEDTSPKGVE